MTSSDGTVKPTGTRRRCPSEGEVPPTSLPVRPSVTQSTLNKTRGEDSGIAASSVNQNHVSARSSSSSQVSWGYQIEEYAAQFSTKESSLDSQENALREGGLGDRNVLGLREQQQEEGDESVEFLSAEEIKLSRCVPTTKGQKQHELGGKDSEEQSTNSELPSKQSIPPPALRRFLASPTHPGAVAVPGPNTREGGINNSEQQLQRYDSSLNQEGSSIQHPAAVRPGEQIVDAFLVVSQVAVAQKDSFVGLLRHDRRTRMIAACFLVALVGLGVGLGVALSQNNSDTSEPEETYLQAGSDIDGPDQFFESGSGEGSKFGKAVALSGDGMFLVVGAPEYSSNEDDVVGLVQLFEERDNDWALMETYVGESSGDRMGTAVAASLDGNTVAIASPGYMEDRGQVQFYGRTNSSTTWEPLGAAIVGESPGDELGTSVSISEDGRRVAIGTKKANVTYTEFAKVLDYQAEEWTKVGDDLEGHFGGNPVSLSPDGTTVSLGSLSTEENDFLGAIRVYEFSNNNWARRGTDVLLQGAAGNYSTGWSSSLSRDGKTMAIGSSVENAKAIEEYDLRVEIYRYDFEGSGDWTQQGETQHDKTGSHLIAYRVDLSADAQVLAIGDPGGFAFGVNSGHTHVLRWQNEEWFHITRELEGTDAADRFGDALFLSEDGNRICVGAPSSRSTGVEVGRVQIFELAGVE